MNSKSSRPSFPSCDSLPEVTTVSVYLSNLSLYVHAPICVQMEIIFVEVFFRTYVHNALKFALFTHPCVLEIFPSKQSGGFVMRQFGEAEARSCMFPVRVGQEAFC